MRYRVHHHGKPWASNWAKPFLQDNQDKDDMTLRIEGRMTELRARANHYASVSLAYLIVALVGTVLMAWSLWFAVVVAIGAGIGLAYRSEARAIMRACGKPSFWQDGTL
jgi:hypothetical protein